jgi:hypothetical protein
MMIAIFRHYLVADFQTWRYQLRRYLSINQLIIFEDKNLVYFENYMKVTYRFCV